MKTLRRTANSHPVALPLGYNLQDASPQAISERTSYCQTRLEFLLYTQVIPSCCTASGCGPPRGFTHASPCSYVARLASGLVHATIIRPIQARFHYVSGIRHPLDSRVELTRWIVLQKAHRHPELTGLRFFVSMEFQFYFTSLIGILFTFPSRY